MVTLQIVLIIIALAATIFNVLFIYTQCGIQHRKKINPYFLVRDSSPVYIARYTFKNKQIKEVPLDSSLPFHDPLIPYNGFLKISDEVSVNADEIETIERRQVNVKFYSYWESVDKLYSCKGLTILDKKNLTEEEAIRLNNEIKSKDKQGDT